MYDNEFHDIFLEEKQTPEFANLLRKMKVLDDNEESEMDADQFEAVSTSTILSLLLSGCGRAKLTSTTLMIRSLQGVRHAKGRPVRWWGS